MLTLNQKILNSPLAEKTYVVGGAIRDLNLKQPVNDIDYVVTVSQEEFLQHFPNVEMVGQDFPVFLIDGDEVALSRTERSTGSGYGTFELTGVGVSIEEDLSRRDFTINAVAMNVVTKEIVDPFNGLADLSKGRITVTHSESFKDDPVRILRAFRFASRFGFRIEDDTLTQAMKFGEELKFVTKERIVLELEKVWKQSEKPSSFFRAASKTGLLDELIPNFGKMEAVPAGPVEFHGKNTAFDHTMETIDRAKAAGAPFHVFVAMIFHDFGKAFTDPEILPKHFGHEDRSAELAEEFLFKHRFSKRVKEFVPKAAKLHMKAHRVTEMSARKLAKFAIAIGRRDFEDFIIVAEADHPFSEKERKVVDIMREIVFNTDMSEVATVPPNQRAQKAHQLRVSRIKHLLRSI